VEETHIKRRIKELDAKAHEIDVQQIQHEAAKKAVAEMEREREEIRTCLNPEPGESLPTAALRAGIALSFGEDAIEDAAKLKSEKTRLADQLARNEAEITRIEVVLKPDTGESLLTAAKRITACAEEAVDLKSRVHTLEAEGKRLHAERDAFKSEATTAGSVLQQIRAALGIKADAEIAPAVKRVVSGGAKVPELENRIEILENDLDLAQKTLSVEGKKVQALEKEIGLVEAKAQSLEKEIGPLRLLAQVAGKFLDAVMAKGPKLGADLIVLLKEMGQLVGKKYEPKRKEDPGVTMP
jgi:chromosome segregation ATPase